MLARLNLQAATKGPDPEERALITAKINSILNQELSRKEGREERGRAVFDPRISRAAGNKGRIL